MKIFIIGCGRILKKHIETINVLNKKLKIVGISDIIPSRLRQASKILKVKGYKDYKIGIRDTNPDIVSILSPSGKHAIHIMNALKLNKHVNGKVS